jgi:hypothetical protein
MLENVAAFVWGGGGLHQMLQPSFPRQCFCKHCLKARIATNKQVHLLGNDSLKLILMSTNIQQRFPGIRGILGSPFVSATTDTGDQ